MKIPEPALRRTIQVTSPAFAEQGAITEAGIDLSALTVTPVRPGDTAPFLELRPKAPRAGFLEDALRDVRAVDLVPRLREHLRHPAPHHAGSDHCDAHLVSVSVSSCAPPRARGFA